jgi:hypothetical protein
MKQAIHRQIRSLTQKLLSDGFTITQNHPVIDGDDIVWQGYQNISFALRNQKYEDIYDECLKAKAFNVLFLDGAILQLMYRFNRRQLVSQRLAYLPNPKVEQFQDYPEDYEEVHYGANLFSEMRDENLVAFPIRFDYDADETKFIEYDHPFSHMTLGNYSRCRIPVFSPVSPFRFLQFVLRNFYFEKFKETFTERYFMCDIRFDKTITKSESQYMHMHFEKCSDII